MPNFYPVKAILNNMLLHQVGNDVLLDDSLFKSYLEGDRIINCIPGVVDVPGKNYNTLKKCCDYFNDSDTPPSEDNQCLIVLKNNDPNSVYTIGDSDGFNDYINIRAMHQRIAIAIIGNTISAKIRFENCTILFGAGETAGSNSARDLTGMEFDNCLIYHWRNVTLKGGLVDNSRIICPSDKVFTLDKDGNDVYTNIFDTKFKTDPAIVGAELSYGGIRDFVTFASLPIINDPT